MSRPLPTPPIPLMGSSVVRWLAIGLGIALLLGIAFWAGRVTLRSPSAPQASSGDLLVTVTEQTVGKAYTFSVTVSRSRRPIAANQLSGVVTSVKASGTFRDGDVAYAVDDIPVRLVTGRHPFYRALRRGLSGTDVRQLNASLAAAGLMSGSVDSMFDAETERAVRRWQRRLGQPQTGVVGLGELVAVPRLPGTLVIDGQAARLGALVSPGAQLLYRSGDRPDFVLRLAADQARLVPATARLVVHHGKDDWDAVITKATADADNSSTDFVLAGADGGVVCGSACGSLGVDSATSLLADVTVVPPKTGPAVPVSAILTGTDGTTWLVVQRAGQRVRQDVMVLASQDGVAVVSGVTVGDRVQAVVDSNAAPTQLPPTTGPGSATSASSPSAPTTSR